MSRYKFMLRQTNSTSMAHKSWPETDHQGVEKIGHSQKERGEQNGRLLQSQNPRWRLHTITVAKTRQVIFSSTAHVHRTDCRLNNQGANVKCVTTTYQTRPGSTECAVLTRNELLCTRVSSVDTGGVMVISGLTANHFWGHRMANTYCGRVAILCKTANWAHRSRDPLSQNKMPFSKTIRKMACPDTPQFFNRWGNNAMPGQIWPAFSSHRVPTRRGPNNCDL